MTERSARDAIELIASALEIPPDRLNAQSSMATVPEWDSMAHLNICLAMQDRFGIVMDLETVGRATSVAALTALLSKA